MMDQFSQFSGIGNGNQFPNPFADIASLSLPSNFRSALFFSEYIFNLFGTYRMAMERVISYFITPIEVLNSSDDEAEKWKGLYNDVLDIPTIVQSMDRSRMCYGNSFASVLVPFKRFLVCPKCGYLSPLKNIVDNKAAFNFEWSMPNFVATCPAACKNGAGYRGPWHVRDEKDDEEKKIKIKIWNPHEMEILHDPYSHEMAYLWRIPEDYKRLVRQGNLFHLERCPKEVIKAIHKNQVYRFHPDAIFHMKEPTLAGTVNRGWGLPRTLINFRQIYYVQVLRRFNEAIALDYVVPFRIITPAPLPGKAGGGMAIDPLQMYNGGDFRQQVNQMIRRRRRDPASIQVMPMPVQFQMFGADANQLAPRDLLDQGTETLLNDSGAPIELYNGSLQLQAAPVALRLFEATWHHLVHDNNAFLAWTTRQISQIMSWEVVNVQHKRVTIADNLEQQMMAAQMMMSQQLSGGTVLGDFGYNWRKEQKQIAEESRYQAELQARNQEEMEQSGFASQIAKGQDPNAQGGQGGGQGGGQPQGGQQQGMAPPQGPVSQYLASMGPNVPQTPQDMLAAADSLADQLLGQPESTKDSELRKLKTYNVPLHSMVMERMKDKRQQAKNQVAQSQAQQGQGQPPPGG